MINANVTEKKLIDVIAAERSASCLQQRLMINFELLAVGQGGPI